MSKLKIKVNDLTTTFKIDEEIEHRGIKSASELRGLFLDRFQVYAAKVIQELAKRKITITNDKGKSESLSLLDLQACMYSPYISRLLVYNIQEKFKSVLLKTVRKDGHKPVWRPRWGSEAWTTLNKVMVNNRKPIVKLIVPKTVPDEAAFVTTTHVETLIAQGYLTRLTTTKNDTVRIKYMGWGSEKKIEQADMEGYWLILTKLGRDFHKRNTDKQFRMINKLSGDPNTDDDEINADVYPSRYF